MPRDQGSFEWRERGGYAYSLAKSVYNCVYR